MYVRADFKLTAAVSLLLGCCCLVQTAAAQATRDNRTFPFRQVSTNGVAVQEAPTYGAPPPTPAPDATPRDGQGPMLRDGQSPMLRYDNLIQIAPSEVAAHRMKLDSLLDRPATAINLASALRLASVRTPQILIAQNRVLHAVAQRQLAAAQFLPTLRGGMNYDQHSGALQQSSGNVLPVNRSAMFVGAGANAVAAGTVGIPGLGWNMNVAESIFDYLSTRQLVQQREFDNRAQENEMLRRVADAYVNLLRSAGQRAVALRTRDEARLIYSLTEAWGKAGAGRQADVERMAGELARREINLAQAEYGVVAASAQLEEILNLDPNVQLHPIEASVVPTPIVPEAIPLEQLLAIALVNRPELASQQAMIQQTLLTLRKERLLPFSPNVILMFSAGMFGGGSDISSGGRIPPSDAASVINNGLAFGAPVNQPRWGEFATRVDADVISYWELKNLGIGNTARIRAAGSRVEQAGLERLETLNRVRREVASAYVRTHSRFAQLLANERSVRSALLAFEEDQKRIRGNVGHPIELVTSLRLLAEARTEYVNNISDYNQAHIDLYSALGQPPADVLARPVPQDESSLPGNEPRPPQPVPQPLPQPEGGNP